MNGFLWLVVGGWVVIVVAFVRLAKSRWRCSSCRRIHRNTVAQCECGEPRPAPAPADDTAQIAELVGGPSAAREVRQWLEAARIGGKLSPETWELLGGAFHCVRDRRLDAVRNYVAVMDELSRAEKARLLTSAEGSIALRNEIDGQLELIAIGYEAATRTFEFTAHHQGTFDVREPPQMSLLRAIVADGVDPDGNIVDTVRVVFIDLASARREAVRLSDAGAKVYVYDATGELAELR